MGDGLSVEQKKVFVESIVYERDGNKFIQLGNCSLDFKAEFVYLGMTKTGKAILGDIHARGPGLLEYNKKYGFVEVRDSHQVDGSVKKQVRIWTDGYRYSETLGVIEQ